MSGLQLPVVGALATSSAYLVALLLSLRRRGFSSWLHGLFVLYLILSILWNVGRALVVWRGFVPQVPQLGWEMAYGTVIVMPIILAVLTVLFFERPRAQWIATIGGVAVLLVVVIDNNLLNLQVELQHGLGASSSRELLHWLRLSVWGGFNISAIALTVWDYVLTWRPLHRNRILYWLIALLLIVTGEGVTLAFSGGYERLGQLVRMGGVLLMTYAVTSYYLPNLRMVLGKSLVAILVTLSTGGLYLFMFMLARPVMRALDEVLLWPILAVLALVMAILVPPIRHWINGVVDRFLFGGRYDPARALRDYSAAISNILDLNTLVTIAIGIISEAMEAKRGAFLLLTDHEDGTVGVAVVPGMGDFKLTMAEFSADSPILNYLRSHSQPLTHYEIDMLPQFRSAPVQERRWLRNLDLELYVPIRQQSLLVGIVALGERAGGAPYAPQDMNVLSTLADQTTVALQNARLVADLKALNAQMSHLNEELRQTNRRLEKLDAAKSDFIQIASHELRTPLTQVRGYSDMMADILQTGTPSQTQVIQVSQGISRATQRLEEIIRAMLDVSQIDVQALNLTRAPLAMMTAIRMAVEPYRDGLAQRKQTFVVEGIEGLPPVHGDLQRLCQAFGNLIVNCIKYTPDGGQITVTGRSYQTVNEEGKSTFVEVVIADTGIGIDPADQELIFEKFYRVGSLTLHSTGSTKFMGAGPGLGLPIARGVIEAHGGRVWVESEGRDEQRCPGSKFFVVLPAVNVEAPGAA